MLDFVKLFIVDKEAIFSLNDCSSSKSDTSFSEPEVSTVSVNPKSELPLYISEAPTEHNPEFNSSDMSGFSAPLSS